MTDENTRKSTNRRTFLKLTGVGSSFGLTGLAGCLTGGGDGDSGGGDGGGTATATDAGDGDGGGDGGGDGDGDNGGLDFGGAELNVMVNVGAIDTVHKKYLIPRVEEKYNLSINTETAVTTQQLTKVQANPEAPPDVLVPDVIGIEKASRNDWLEPLSDHTDIVTNLSDIFDKFVHYDSTGVSWEIGEVAPVINTELWDSTPKSYEEVMKNSEATALVPFSWSGGPYLLLMAAAIATGEPYDSPDLDVEAGFDYLEEHLKPNVKNTYQGVASAKQQLASGNVDTTNVFWDYMVFDMFLSDAPVEVVFRPEPVGIAFAETVAVTKNSGNMEAALAYANECLSPWFQEKMSAEMGAGVTNKKAEVDPDAKEFGAATPDKFDQLEFPNFRYIWENRDSWSERWNSIFSG